jgi:GT2 family glycosyltransferase
MSRRENPHLSVIILNWNTWQDTIECIESLYHNTYDNFSLIVVDNNSTDNSIIQIQNWASGKAPDQMETKFPEYVSPGTGKPLNLMMLSVLKGKIEQSKNPIQKNDRREFILLKNDHNAGFAEANNMAINFALRIKQSNYIYILNNDTVLETKALSELIDLLEKNKDIGVATSTVYHYDQPQEIAIAGGKITPWAKVIHYHDKIPGDFRKTHFVSGCALMVRSNVFQQHGFFSDRFFYGEEDIEFSWRMNTLKIKMVCLYTSIVYHKVSRSARKYFSSRPEKVYLNALNRLINMKLYFSPVKWFVWRFFLLSYFFYLFTGKHHVPVRRAMNYLGELYKLSSRLDHVNKTTVESILSKF